VTIRTAPSRREFRGRDATAPVYLYTLAYEFLRSSAAMTELQSLVGFFNARGGSFDSFLFTDPDDCAATGQLFGTGNGTATQFQLTRAFGGFGEAVCDLNGTPTIYGSGSVISSGSYSISATGLVTFTAPIANSVPLTWTGAFYRRVRFMRDQMDLTKFMADLWEARKVELLSIKAGGQ
jgi:uncharacterized protein (TIGR02217 family)